MNSANKVLLRESNSVCTAELAAMYHSIIVSPRNIAILLDSLDALLAIRSGRTDYPQNCKYSDPTSEIDPTKDRIGFRMDT